MTVLLVDDEELLRDLVQETLEEADFKVVSAASGEAGLKALAESDQSVQALLTDIDLGRERLSGWDVARAARRARPGLPVIYMTGASGNDWATMGVAGSILLSKPFVLRHLLATLALLLHTPSPGTA
ncbi:response regulator [Phreatobacter aquaticus]|uniref:Response regulator n=2 Tax=Phreatobacter aquaticus TaxID=2570229 RepID=A0A4D7QNB4_9HYPH|nr:response regulator [Phreatobacter aquaticus]